MKEEVFNKIKSVIESKCKMELSDEYKPILEKHDEFNTNITLSDKLTSVSDPDDFNDYHYNVLQK